MNLKECFDPCYDLLLSWELLLNADYDTDKDHLLKNPQKPIYWYKEILMKKFEGVGT